MDFTKYDDVLKMKGYDGYIDPQGHFYRVKMRLRPTCNHEIWAEEYLKTNALNCRDIAVSESLILNLVTLKTYTEKLIHLHGFIYYSHDELLYKPIIKLPNPKIFGKRATEEQMDALYSIMLINNEKTNIPIFDGALDYIGLEDESKEVDYEEDKYKRFK